MEFAYLTLLTNFTGVGIATITILIRCCFRVAELHEGYGGDLANDEVLYMVLEGAMVVIAVMALTVGHPGPILGSYWKEIGMKSSKGNASLGQRNEKTASDTSV